MQESHAQRLACLGCKALCAETEAYELLTMQREGQRAAVAPDVPLKFAARALRQAQEVFLG